MDWTIIEKENTLIILQPSMGWTIVVTRKLEFAITRNLTTWI